MKVKAKKETRETTAIKKRRTKSPSSVKKSVEADKNFIPVSKRTGVVYLGGIPHGFYEQQMRKYFTQFGKVLRVRLARSKRTGRSKGFAYIEFANAEVAKIIADTMHNYLMCNRLLRAEVIPYERGYDKYFRGHPWNEKINPKKFARRNHIEEKNRYVDPEKENELKKRSIYRLNKVKEKLLADGIDWDPELDLLPSVANSKKKVVEVAGENSNTTDSNDESPEITDDNGAVTTSEEDNTIPSMEDDDDSDEHDSSEENSTENTTENSAGISEEESEDEVEEEEDDTRKSKKVARSYQKLMQRKAGAGISKKKLNKPEKFQKQASKKLKMAAGETVKTLGADLKKKVHQKKKKQNMKK